MIKYTFSLASVVIFNFLNVGKSFEEPKLNRKLQKNSMVFHGSFDGGDGKNTTHNS